MFSRLSPRCLSRCGIGCSPLCHRDYLCNQKVSRQRCAGASGVWNLQAGLTLGWRIPVKYIHASEKEGLFVWCYTKHSATLLRDSTSTHPPPLRHKKRNPSLKLGGGKMKRKASAAASRSFWCLWNTHSIIKAALHVKLFVLFPEQNSKVRTCNGKSFSWNIEPLHARCLCTASAGDWMEIYIISTLGVSTSDLVERNKERWRNL